MPDDPRAWRFRSESTSMERLEGETILIDFETGQFYSFRESAADIVWLIHHGLPRGSWAPILGTTFPDFTDGPDSEAQIDAFVSALEAAGLIEPTSPSAGEIAALPDDYERTAWRAPTIAVNDTLADLLAIDPIHDVSDDGWPETRQS